MSRAQTLIVAYRRRNVTFEVHRTHVAVWQKDTAVWTETRYPLSTIRGAERSGAWLVLDHQNGTTTRYELGPSATEAASLVRAVRA